MVALSLFEVTKYDIENNRFARSMDRIVKNKKMKEREDYENYYFTC